MAVTLKYIGQSAMDSYYKEYKGNTGFFTLDDFIFRAAATVADYYQRLYDAKYAELRQEKRHKDELIGVDPDLLSVQELTFKDGAADITYPVMTFIYDKSSVGYQFVLPVTPADVKLERASMDEVWQQDYLPKTNRIFWRPQNGEIKLFKNGDCNIQKAELYYIPSVMSKDGTVLGEAMIADGLIDAAVNMTVLKMKQVEQGTIIKEGLDGNKNPTLETEVNPKSFIR